MAALMWLRRRPYCIKVVRQPLQNNSDLGERQVASLDSQNIPFISTDQMREVDRAMIEDYGILLIQMMENAGRELANVARLRFLNGDPKGSKVLVLAGTGGNGGGGLVCARRLHNWGAHVEVLLSSPVSRLTDVPKIQYDILVKMGVNVTEATEDIALPSADLIVDAIIGYSLRGAPRGISRAMILAANDHPAPVLSLDVPSGIDTATGTVYDPAIKADATLTLALPKDGLRGDAARERVGELYVADISVPPELYARPPLNLQVGPIFSEESIVRLW